MKNDVVRWKVQNSNKNYNNNNNNNFKNHIDRRSKDFDRAVNVCVLAPPLPQLSHVSPRVVSSASTTTKTKKPLRHNLASAARNCDKKNNIKKSFLLVYKNVKNSHKTRICQRACSATDVVSLKKFVPYSTSCALHTLTNVQCRHPQSRFVRRRTVFSLISTKLLIVSLQLLYLVLLCNINVGLAVSIADTLPNELYDHEYRADDGNGSAGHFTHTWAVHIPDGDSGLADDVARDHDFVNLGKVVDGFQKIEL